LWAMAGWVRRKWVGMGRDWPLPSAPMPRLEAIILRAHPDDEQHNERIRIEIERWLFHSVLSWCSVSVCQEEKKIIWV